MIVGICNFYFSTIISEFDHNSVQFILELRTAIDIVKNAVVRIVNAVISSLFLLIIDIND